MVLTLQTLIKGQSPKGLQSDYQTLIPSASALPIWTPITVNLAPIIRQRATASPLLTVCIPTLKHMKNAKKAAQVTLRQIIRENHRPLTKAPSRRRRVKTP